MPNPPQAGGDSEDVVALNSVLANAVAWATALSLLYPGVEGLKGTGSVGCSVDFDRI